MELDNELEIVPLLCIGYINWIKVCSLGANCGLGANKPHLTAVVPVICQVRLTVSRHKGA